MSTELAQKLTLAAKESSEVALFSFFSKLQSFLWFTTHALRFVLFPIIGVTFLVNAIIEGYKLKKAKNKNVESVFGFISTVASAALAIASITGTVLAGAGVIAAEFVAGPFLFVAALSVGITFQLGMLLINSIRALNAPSNSIERKAFIQSSLNNLFNAVLLGLIAATVISVMISPAGPAVLAALAITAATLTAVNLVWRILPHEWKLGIKSFLGLAKPKLDLSNIVTQKHSNALIDGAHVEPTPGIFEKKDEIKPSYTSRGLFTASFRRHKVMTMLNSGNLDGARNYVIQQVKAKQLELTTKLSNGKNDIKHQSKLLVVNHLLESLENKETDATPLKSITSLSDEQPRAFQSAWSSVGDTEDLYNAVKLFNESEDDVVQTQKVSFT